MEQSFNIFAILAFFLSIAIRKANNNKRGEWIDQHYDENMDTWFATCTNCGYTSSDRYIIGGSHFYCERCGAKMKIIKYS